MPEHGLGLMLALVGGEPKPAGGHDGVARPIRSAVEKHSAKIVLRVAVSKIRAGILEELDGSSLVDVHGSIRNAMQVVGAESDHCARDEACLCRAGVFVGMCIDDRLIVLESLIVVARDAVTLRIHTCELPLRKGVALACGELERPGCAGEIPRLVGLRA